MPLIPKVTIVLGIREKFLVFLSFALFQWKHMQFQYAVAGVADIILGRPAGGACPAATKGALLQLRELERIVTEIAVIL